MSKKIIISLLFIFSLFGCEFENFIYYSEPSEPHLTGGVWLFVDYEIQVISSISPIEIIYNDTICVNTFGDQSFVNGGILMQQIYNRTPIDRRFIIGETTWEFDDNSYSLYINGNTNLRFPVTYPKYLMKEYDKMSVTNPVIGSTINYSFDSNGIGANYSTELVLLSPEMVSDVYLLSGGIENAVTIRVLLIFRR